MEDGSSRRVDEWREVKGRIGEEGLIKRGRGAAAGRGMCCLVPARTWDSCVLTFQGGGAERGSQLWSPLTHSTCVGKGREGRQSGGTACNLTSDSATSFHGSEWMVVGGSGEGEKGSGGGGGGRREGGWEGGICSGSAGGAHHPPPRRPLARTRPQPPHHPSPIITPTPHHHSTLDGQAGRGGGEEDGRRTGRDKSRAVTCGK